MIAERIHRTTLRLLAAGACGVGIVGPTTMMAQAMPHTVTTPSRLPIDSEAFVTAVSEPMWQLLARASCPTAPWNAGRNGMAPTPMEVADLRAAFLQRVGPIPTTRAGAVWARRTLYDGPKYKIEVVVLTHRLSAGLSYGLLATPKREGKAPAVVLIHGAGTTGRQAFGWHFRRFDPITYPDAPLEMLGADLAERGYVVFTPALRDDQFSNWPHFWWPSLERQGMAYRVRTGGSAYGLVMGQLESVIDFLGTEPGVDADKIATMGWEEGADFAAGVGILDRRVKAVVRMMPPLDRRRWRATEAGTKANPGMMQLDCTFGEAEQLAMLAPTPVRYDWTRSDPTFVRHRFFVDSGALAPGRLVYQASGSGLAVSLESGVAPPSVRHHRIAAWLHTTLGGGTTTAPVAADPPPAPDPTFLLSLRDTVIRALSVAISRTGSCPSLTTRDPNLLDGLPTFEAEAEVFRRSVASAIGAPRAELRPFEIVARDTVERTSDYVIEWVYTTTTSSGLPLAGFLATPLNVEGLRPALLTFDGDFNAGEPFGLPPTGTSKYLKAYGKLAVREGVVVFAPTFPGWFGEAGSAILAAKDPSGPNAWTVTIAHARAATDFLLAQPGVDRNRVTMQGLSFAGIIALYATALDPRLTRLVYSNPVNTADSLFRDPDGMSLAAWYGPVCGTIDRTRKFLVAPRPFIWENGRRDDNGYQGVPLETVRAIRSVYDALGIGGRFTFVQHEGGHEEMPDALRPLNFYSAPPPR